MASTLANDLERNWLGMAMNKATANSPKRIHHFIHHSGTNSVIIKEMPANSTMRIERGMRERSDSSSASFAAKKEEEAERAAVREVQAERDAVRHELSVPEVAVVR